MLHACCSSAHEPLMSCHPSIGTGRVTTLMHHSHNLHTPHSSTNSSCFSLTFRSCYIHYRASLRYRIAPLHDKIAKMEKPTAELSELEIWSFNRSPDYKPNQNMNLQHATLTIRGHVLIHNPYDHDLPIQEITYRFRAESEQLFSGTVENTGSVSANATRKIEVSFEVDYGDMISHSMPVRPITIDYDFDMEVKFNQPTPFTLPLRQKDIFQLPHLQD